MGNKIFEQQEDKEQAYRTLRRSKMKHKTPAHNNVIVAAPQIQPLSTQAHIEIGKMMMAATIARRVLRRQSKPNVPSSGNMMKN